MSLFVQLDALFLMITGLRESSVSCVAKIRCGIHDKTLCSTIKQHRHDIVSKVASREKDRLLEFVRTQTCRNFRGNSKRDECINGFGTCFYHRRLVPSARRSLRIGKADHGKHDSQLRVGSGSIKASSVERSTSSNRPVTLAGVSEEQG